MLFILILTATLWRSSSQSPTMVFIKVTACNDNSSTVIGSSVVSIRAECAKKCAEDPNCKSYDVSEESGQGLQCKLYEICWSKGSCSAVFYNKNLCEKNKACTCVGGELNRTCPVFMEDCAMGYTYGMCTKSGVYLAWPKSAPGPFKVYCRVTKNRAYTMVQRNTLEGKVDFNRTWDEYDVGFGDLNGDHWLGNSKIHHLTQRTTRSTLTISILAGTQWRSRYYFGFKLANKDNLFRFYFDRSESELVGNHLYACRSANQPFQTWDNKNIKTINCALQRGSGWWFKNCMSCAPNSRITGQVYSTETDVNWVPGVNQSLVIYQTWMLLR